MTAGCDVASSSVSLDWIPLLHTDRAAEWFDATTIDIIACLGRLGVVTTPSPAQVPVI